MHRRPRFHESPLRVVGRTPPDEPLGRAGARGGSEVTVVPNSRALKGGSAPLVDAYKAPAANGSQPAAPCSNPVVNHCCRCSLDP